MKRTYLIIPAMMLVALVAVYAWADTTDVKDEFGFLADSRSPEAMEVVEDPTIYRVAELKDLPCDAATFEFLLDRPKISMLLARKVDPSVDDYEFKTEEDGSYSVKDQNGLTGTMDLLEAEPGKRVYYMTGHYELFWGMEFDGDVVMVPEYTEKPAPEGGVLTDATARSYFKVHSAIVGMMASFVAYVFPSKVDSRIKRFTKAITMVTGAVAEDPEGMYAALKESGRLDDTELEEFRDFFLGRPNADRGVEDDGQGHEA